jgi:hypothetical protein
MPHRSWTLAIELVVALAMTIGSARASDDVKYPSLKGQWNRFGGPPGRLGGLPGQLSFDQSKPWGPGQQAPLTPEYKAMLEASMADQASGGLGNYPQALCLAAGMPHMMIGFLPQEYIITPETTYILIGYVDHYRRITCAVPILVPAGSSIFARKIMRRSKSATNTIT